MILAQALAITENELERALNSMSADEINNLYKEVTDEQNWREGDDFQTPKVLIIKAWNRTRCK